ncbi:hypothetical protein MFUM_270048 [Methylacidiphilum fumariolicum SolV]|uniref:Uncharacterized protein n=1 Tax=Methylacidiphilum fumariolicum (strain SolV) TaxID=1156937 RepID=I0JXI2_METFB|nr:hypothetical protein MFUM_270048 [Methylacidiphilum fumariolicum SolV]
MLGGERIIWLYSTLLSRKSYAFRIYPLHFWGKAFGVCLKIQLKSLSLFFYPPSWTVG